MTPSIIPYRENSWVSLCLRGLGPPQILAIASRIQRALGVAVSNRIAGKLASDTVDINTGHSRRRRRFQAVRRTFLTALQGSVSVAHIAHSHGFMSWVVLLSVMETCSAKRPSEILATSRRPLTLRPLKHE